MYTLRKLFCTTSLVMIMVAPAVFPDQAYARPIHEIRNAKATGLVEIETVSVDLKIVGVKGSKIKVDGELPDHWKLDLSVSGSKTKIKIRPDKGSSGGDDAKLIVTIPRGAPVHAKTVSGDLEFRDVGNRLHVSTVSGDIKGAVAAKEVEIKSVSGDVDLRSTIRASAFESARLQSVSGDIDLGGIGGKLNIKSVSGDIKVANSQSSRAEVAATSGDIHYSGRLLPTGPHAFKSHSGDLQLKVKKGDPIEVSAQSLSGDIKDGFSGRQYEGRSKPKFSVGSGGPTVNLRTFSGDIAIGPP